MSETFNPRNSMESRHAADVSKAVIASLKERAEGAERAVTDMLHALGCEIVPVDYAATMATAKRQAIDILKRELGEALAQRDAAEKELRAFASTFGVDTDTPGWTITTAGSIQGVIDGAKDLLAERDAARAVLREVDPMLAELKHDFKTDDAKKVIDDMRRRLAAALGDKENEHAE